MPFSTCFVSEFEIVEDKDKLIEDDVLPAKLFHQRQLTVSAASRNLIIRPSTRKQAAKVNRKKEKVRSHDTFTKQGLLLRDNAYCSY